MTKLNIIIAAAVLCSQPALAEIFKGETSRGDSCSIELNESKKSGVIDVKLIADDTAYAFGMPENKLSHSVSLLERGERYYSTYIGAPITIFGIGVRDIKLNINLKDDGTPDSFKFAVTNKLVFGAKVKCENLKSK